VVVDILFQGRYFIREVNKEYWLKNPDKRLEPVYIEDECCYRKRGDCMRMRFVVLTKDGAIVDVVPPIHCSRGKKVGGLIPVIRFYPTTDTILGFIYFWTSDRGTFSVGLRYPIFEEPILDKEKEEEKRRYVDMIYNIALLLQALNCKKEIPSLPDEDEQLGGGASD